MSFFLSKKNLTQKCAADPTGWGCFLDGDNMYGRFTVEFDGGYGPYFECNPIDVYETQSHAPHKEPPHWSDTRKFECGQGCLQPTDNDCHIDPRHVRNGTYGFGGAMQCFCDGTARHNATVGREVPPSSGHNDDIGPCAADSSMSHRARPRAVDGRRAAATRHATPWLHDMDHKSACLTDGLLRRAAGRTGSLSVGPRTTSTTTRSPSSMAAASPVRPPSRSAPPIQIAPAPIRITSLRTDRPRRPDPAHRLGMGFRISQREGVRRV